MSGRLRAARLKIFSPYRPIPPGEEKMVVTFRRPLLCSAAGMRATTLARIELRRSPCSPLPRFLEGAPVGLLWPSSRATLLPSEARRLSLQTPGCLDPPAPAFYLASHRELSGGRQCFWACNHRSGPHHGRAVHCSVCTQWRRIHVTRLAHDRATFVRQSFQG
jgi:hypothetical protein